MLIIDTPYQRGHEDLPFLPNSNCGTYAEWDEDGCSGFISEHGTHVLGTLAALDNGIGVIGGAHGIHEDDLYFFPYCDPENPNDCRQAASAAGIQWGIDKEVDVISMSYRSYNYNITEEGAVWLAHDYFDIVLVAALGNHYEDSTFYVSYPANYPDVIGVSGHRENGDPAIEWDRCYAVLEQQHWDSDWGPHADIAAPYEAWSTVFNHGYDHEMPWCGTSMAAPHVSATVAIMRAKNPTLSNSTIESILLATATDAGAPGWDNIYGFGRLNANLAIATVAPPPPPPPPLVAQINGPIAIESWETCSWTASYSGGSGTPTYQWHKNGFLVGTSSTVYLSNPPFNLMLTVTRGGEADSDTRYIPVGTSPACGV